MPNSEPMRAMRDCVLFRGLPEAAVHRITARTNKGRGQRPARKTCRPGDTVCDPGDRSHNLRLEEEGEIRIIVSDNSCLEQPPRVKFAWNQVYYEDNLMGFR